MTTFEKGQSITFRRHGETMTGTVEDVGTGLWGVRMKDRNYYAVYESDLVEQTPATRAGLKLGDIVVVGVGIKCPHAFRVGEEAVFKRDDRSSSPLFEQYGETQYLDLTEITIGRKPDTRTPAEKAGLKVGDTVKLLDQEFITYFGSEYIKFKLDDGSTTPRFGEGAKSLWLKLSDVQKVPEGPKAGVKWTDAPVGATHYSMNEQHASNWHKQDEAGNWFYFNGGRFTPYREQRYATAETQVAIPGVVVDVNPLNAVLDEVKALEGRVAGRLTTIEGLNRDVARLNIEKQAKLDRIKAGGFKVEGGKLVKTGKPVSEWQDGDKVKCITREGKGLANITVGGVYVVSKRYGAVCVVDGGGDAMRGCVERGCFEFHEAAPDLASVPASEWKAGDTVQALEAGWDITYGERYTITAMCNASGPHIRIKDDVDYPRRRPASEFKLVARK